MRRHFLLFPIMVLVFGATEAQPERKQVPASATDQKKKVPATGESYCKVEMRGELKIGLFEGSMLHEGDFPPLSPPLKKQPIIATVKADKVFLRLYFHQDKKLLEFAKELKEKTVLVTGKLRWHWVYVGEGGAGSRLLPPTQAETWPRFEYYLEVDTLKSAGP